MEIVDTLKTDLIKEKENVDYLRKDNQSKHDSIIGNDQDMKGKAQEIAQLKTEIKVLNQNCNHYKNKYQSEKDACD